jgi:hypothetical protein
MNATLTQLSKQLIINMEFRLMIYIKLRGKGYDVNNGYQVIMRV